MNGMLVSGSEALAKPLQLPVIPVRVEVDVPIAAAQVADDLQRTGKHLKVAMAQITTYPGQIAYNTAKIISCITKAREAGASLVVFPEMTIPGYAAMDLLFREDYIKANLQALKEIQAASKGIAVIVGFADVVKNTRRPGGRPELHNAAAIISDGEILHVQDKQLHPNYNIFFEDRYFAPMRERKVVEIAGVKVGVEICEDLWNEEYSDNPTASLVDDGAEIIVNLSASPFHIGKLPVRAGLIQQKCAAHQKPFIYTNLVGSFDGYEGDVVFDGQSMLFSEQGTLSAIGKPFGEEIIVTDVHTPQAVAMPEVSEIEDLRQALVLGIREYFQRLDMARTTREPMKAVIGVSGGIDSALVAALAVEALGADRVCGVTMPSVYSSGETKGDAYRLAEALGMALREMPIQGSFDQVLGDLGRDCELAERGGGVADENVQARLRMMILMYYANALHGVVLNTGNKTELALNNCTIYGDMVGGFSVLGDVDKDRVFALARHMNQRAGREIIPVSTIERVPSAELKPNQVDAQVMGADPQKIAPVVRAVLDENLLPEEAVGRFGELIPPPVICGIYRKLDESEWKRRQASPGIRVTPAAFGNGRRVPIGHGFDENL